MKHEHMSPHREHHERHAGKIEHEHRHHRAHGGAESPEHGDDDAREDLEDKPMSYTAKSKVTGEAEERKHGGHVRRRRRHGGEVHHSACKCEKCMGGKVEHRAHGGHVEKHEKHHEAKHLGKMHGEHAKHHAGHKPRKSGGRAGSDASPFSSARHGTDPKGHKTDMEFD